MSQPTLQIVQPGMLSTVQDTGRYGYQRFGMPTAGAVDTFALRAANALLGNHDDDAGIEATVLGPRITFLADTRIAITGADVSPQVDGEPIPMWEAVDVREGGALRFQGPRDGMRSYLAVSGGIDVPVVMGSRSTYIKAGIGGKEGRALRAGDILNAFGDEPREPVRTYKLPSGMIPKYGSNHELRVVLGPQSEGFTQAGIETFLSAMYGVSIQSDRMGYRLEGDPIEHVESADVISDGTPMGAIQVPGNGQPIILLADRGTTGGYTKIATVISTDISKVAQAMPGHMVTFRAVSVEEAQEAYRRQEAMLNVIRYGPISTARIAVVMDEGISDILSDSGDVLAMPVRREVSSYSHRGVADISGDRFEFEIKVRRLDD